MSKDSRMGGVTIGNVGGDIKGSIIAGHDVREAVIKIGARSVPADKQPDATDLKELLFDLQREIAQLAAQGELLKRLSPSASLIAQSAAISVQDAAEKVATDVSAEDAGLIRTRVTEAASFMSTLLDNAKTLALRADEAEKVIEPVATKLAPLIDKLGVAALWVARLWLPI